MPGRQGRRTSSSDIRAKYREYGITEEPFVIVKADAGTYGMGIMTVKSPDEVRDLNRKQRNKMAVVQGRPRGQRVMVQEGVYTFESVNDAVAEPVVYMIDHFVVGGFYRVHTERGTDENLNAPGMQFVPLAFDAHLLSARLRRLAGRAAEPLLRLWRGLAPGAAGGVARSSSSEKRRPTRRPPNVARRGRSALDAPPGTHEDAPIAFVLDPLGRRSSPTRTRPSQ